MNNKTNNNKAKRGGSKVRAGYERLVVIDGAHYWKQSDGTLRATDWRLENGLAVLRSNVGKGAR